jgi:hypothetical protein
VHVGGQARCGVGQMVVLLSGGRQARRRKGVKVLLQERRRKGVRVLLSGVWATEGS